MRGRKPKPTALKMFEGNRGRRKLPDREPTPTPTPPEMPAWLPAEAKREWQRLVPELMRLAIITIVDRGALADYCVAWSDLRWSTERLKKNLSLSEKRFALSRQRAARSALEKSGADLGLNPSSRTRLRTPEPAGDALDEFQRKHG